RVLPTQRAERRARRHAGTAEWMLSPCDDRRMSDDLETLLTTAREWRMTGQDPRGLRDAAARGQMVRPHRGSYLSTAQWDRLTEIEKYTLRIIGAITSGRENPIVSHISAAVLWGAPIIGPLPSL